MFEKIKKTSKNFFHFIKHEVFSKEYFLFTLNLTARKISIYICAAIYFVILLSYIIAAPLITNEQPTYFFTLPVTSLIMVLLLAIISSYISLEIFRTPIDDGTELLTISKPLHRSQIFFVKSLILLIFGLATATIASILSCFSFTISFADYEQTSYGIIGIFVCTIVCFAVFGGISIFLSMFCKKIVSLLITVGSTFILVFASLLCSLVIDKNGNNPNSAEVAYKNDVARMSYTSIDEKGKANVTQGIYSVVKDVYDLFSEEVLKTEYKQPQQIYNNYFSTLIYPKYAYADFAGQLGSIFMLNFGNKDIFSSLISQSLMSSPYKLKFNKVTDFNASNNANLNLGINLPQINSNNFDINLNFLYVNKYSATITPNFGSITDYTATYQYSFYTYNQQNLVDDKYLDYLGNLDNILISKNFDEYHFKQFEEKDNDLQKVIKVLDNLSLFFKIINEITQESLTQYFETVPNNQLSRINAIKDLDKIIYTGIYRNFVGTNKSYFNLENLLKSMGDSESQNQNFWKDYFNKYQMPLIKFVLIRLLNVNLESLFAQLSREIIYNTQNPGWVIDEQKMKEIIMNSIINAGVFNGQSVPFILQDQPYSFSSGYILSPSNYFVNYQEVQFDSLYDSTLLIFSWLLFSLIIVLVSLVIYRKK
ncbi:MAG: ABC transporter permease, partial [Malacoplasma sp.]|nr:ABC transporter permease [Malacoplasma sp.]